MLITILFFGAAAEAVGARETDLGYRPEETVSDLVGRVREKFPVLREMKLLVARQHRYAAENEMVEPSDEIALFPAVSGG